MRTRTLLGPSLAVAGLLIVAACTTAPITTATGPGRAPGSGPPASTSSASTRPRTPLATAGTALVATDEGLASVPIGARTPAWTVTGGAAADGSAVFATEQEQLYTTVSQRDLRSGSVLRRWDITGDLRVAAVAPGGRWVALVTRPTPAAAHVYAYDAPAPPLDGDQTRLVVLDTEGPRHRVADLVLQGDVEPEAFSPDGALVYTLRHVAGGYRIQTVDLATGSQSPTFGRLKVEGTDMHGEVVASVLNPDRTIQATLYRNPGNALQPAFVHVLDLQNNWAHCADLPATGANGAVGWDTITMTPTGTALVGAAAAGMVAEIKIEAVHDPEGKVTVDVRDDPAPPALPAGLRDVPGFNRLVALVP